MSIIILTAVQRTSSINVVKEIAKTVLWRQCKNRHPPPPPPPSPLLFFFPLSLFVTNNGSKTYGNPLLTLFILFFLFPYFIFSFSFLFFSSSSLLLFYSFETQPPTCLACKRGKLGVSRGRGWGNRRQWPPRRTKRFQQLSRRIVLIIVTSCKRLGSSSQAVLESLTQIPVNVGRNEWSLRKSFFHTTSREMLTRVFFRFENIPPSSSMCCGHLQRYNPFPSFQKSNHRPSDIYRRTHRNF